MMETRHYIGVTPLGRLHMTIGPAAVEDFKTPPTEPITTRGGDVLYPVSAEVAAEWDLDEDDEGVTDEAEVTAGPGSDIDTDQ